MAIQLSPSPNSKSTLGTMVKSSKISGGIQLTPSPKKTQIESPKFDLFTIKDKEINTPTKLGGVTTPITIKPMTQIESPVVSKEQTISQGQVKQVSTFDKIYDSVRNFVMSPGGDWTKEKDIIDNTTVFEQYYREKNPDAKEASPVNKLLNSVNTMSFPEKVIATGVISGTLMNPVNTAIGVIEFGIIDAAIKGVASMITGKQIQNLSDVLPENYPQYSKDVIDVLGFIGTGFAVHGINKKAPAILDKVTKNVVKTYNMPKVMYIEPKMIKDFTTPEQSKIINDLHLTNAEFIDAWKRGITIEVPAERIVTITDKPYWSKIKGMFGLKSTPKVLSISKDGINKITPRGLLEAGKPGEIAPTPMTIQKIEPKILGENRPAVVEAPKVSVTTTRNNLQKLVDISNTPEEFVKNFKPQEYKAEITELQKQSFSEMKNYIKEKYNIKVSEKDIENSTKDVQTLIKKYPALEEPFKKGEFVKISKEISDKILKDFYEQNRQKLPSYQEWLKTNPEALKMISDTTEKAKLIPDTKNRIEFLKNEKAKFDTKFSNEYYKTTQNLPPSPESMPLDTPKTMPADEAKIKAKTELKSRVYERLQQEHPEFLKEDVTYTKKDRKSQTEKAVQIMEADKQEAFNIAMGSKTSDDVLSTSVSIAMQEKALEEGNGILYNTLIKNRTFAQTRRGQEIEAEKGSVSNNNASKFVKELLNSRLAELGKNYTNNLTEGFKKDTNQKRGLDKIDNEVKKLKKRDIKIDMAEAQSIIDKLTCK